MMLFGTTAVEVEVLMTRLQGKKETNKSKFDASEQNFTGKMFISPRVFFFAFCRPVDNLCRNLKVSSGEPQRRVQ